MAFKPITVAKKTTTKKTTDYSTIQKEAESRGRALLRDTYGIKRITTTVTIKKVSKKGADYPVVYLKGKTNDVLCIGVFSSNPAWDKVHQFPTELA